MIFSGLLFSGCDFLPFMVWYTIIIIMNCTLYFIHFIYLVYMFRWVIGHCHMDWHIVVCLPLNQLVQLKTASMWPDMNWLQDLTHTICGAISKQNWSLAVCTPLNLYFSLLLIGHSLLSFLLPPPHLIMPLCLRNTQSSKSGRPLCCSELTLNNSDCTTCSNYLRYNKSPTLMHYLLIFNLFMVQSKLDL